jgi:hypothetical protein
VAKPVVVERERRAGDDLVLRHGPAAYTRPPGGARAAASGAGHAFRLSMPVLASTEAPQWPGRVARLLLLAGLPALGGCVRDSVRSREASDFGCSSRAVHVEPVGDSEYRASGCGRSATYFFVDYYHPVVGPLNRSDDAAPPAAPPPSPAQAPLLEAPSGAGGFAFGASDPEARRACEDAGHL